MFKHFILACAAVLVGSASMHALKPEEVAVPEGMVKGFIGTPFLKSNGWQAEKGAFDLNIGTASSSFDALTNDDPEDYWSTFSIAELTVGYNEIIKMMPIPGHDTQKIKSGNRIGFVVSYEGSKVDVLKLDLVQMFCVNFYKNGELVTSTHANHDNLDVLGLGLISAQLGDKSQQVSLDVPYGENGQELEFDGFSLSVGGLDVNVLQEFRIRYAYLDNFVEVPLIKKYFHNVTASSTGMTSGAKYLVDNNLENGASTAVLNIGGNYYTIMNDKPFPGGIEFGFHITEGTVLDLDLGKAMRIYAMTYPLDANGNYDMTQKPIVASEMSVNFNVVGANLIGGGKTVVCTIADPGVPFFGIKLDVIKGVSLELGATVYHYAYVKLPQTPEIDMPFYTPFHVVPAAEFSTNTADNAPAAFNYSTCLKDGNYTNTFHNTFLLDNSDEMPLTDNNEYWSDKSYPSFSKFATLLRRTSNLSMTLARRALYDDGTEGDFEAAAYLVLHKATTGISAYTGKPVAELNWYEGNSLKNNTVELEYLEGDNGALDLSKIALAMEPLVRPFYFESEFDKHISAFEYALFLPYKDETGLTEDKMKDLENATQISTDYVVIPNVKPTYEMAGIFTHDEVKDAAQTPGDEMAVGEYGNYLIIDMPKFLDEKVEIESVDLMEYEAYEDTYVGIYYDYSRVNALGHYNVDPAKDAVEAEKIAHINAPGFSKVIVKIDPDTRDYVTVQNGNSGHGYSPRMTDLKTKRYFVVANLKYTDAFLNLIKGSHEGMDDMANKKLQYAFVATSTPQHDVPTLELVGEINTENVEGVNNLHHSTWTVNGLEDLTYSHTEYSNTDPIHFTQWWMTKIIEATQPSRAIARAAAEEGEEWNTSISHNETDDDNGSFVESAEYESNSNGMTQAHTAELVTIAPAPENDYNVALHTRAYIPVRPIGVNANDVEPSYLAIEANGNHDVHVDGLEMSGVEDVTVDTDAAAEYFNLQGQPVTNPAAGIYLMRKGNTVSKVTLH